MGSIFRKTVTKAVPDGAKIIVREIRGKAARIATWKDRKGRSRSAPVTIGIGGQSRISITSTTFTAKYRDGSGAVRVVATGCKDATAAKQCLAKLEKRADAVRSGIRTASDDAIVDYRAANFQTHFDAYMIHLEAEGTCVEHRENVKRCINRLKTECRFSKLADFRRESLEAWLVARDKEGMGARTRNIHRACLVAFASWCEFTGRLSTNPFSKVAKADEESDKRRKRRSLTEKELVKLLRSCQTTGQK